jgi:hypothetical protein
VLWIIGTAAGLTWSATNTDIWLNIFTITYVADCVIIGIFLFRVFVFGGDYLCN